MHVRAGHGTRAWVPLGFVFVALVVLLGTPLVVSRRVRQLRQHVTDVADEARLLVSELDVAFARSLLASEPNAEADGGDGASSDAAERAAERGLDSVVTQLGAEAVERLVALRSAEQRWRVASATAKAEPSRLHSTSSTEEARGMVAASASLDQYLFSVATHGKQQVRRLEQFDLYSATVLTPIALVALGIVVWLEREVRAYATAADDRAELLARSVELRATLIHGVVHDVKNPLGAASGYADLLEDGLAGPLNEQQSEMIRRVKRLLGTAQHTVAELVDLARVDAGEYPIERRRTNLAGVVREVVDDYQARATQKSITLTLEAPRDAMFVTTDAARVRHVLENLVSNAIKYTPAAGAVPVTVELVPDGDHGQTARVNVRDTGPGVPAAYRDRIFDPFFRAPSAERATAGSGMGLAISRRIARLLGGDVILAETSESGSTFALVLPLAKADSGTAPSA
ncbi:MAG: sensor histidine kinase [Gemmatimonadaceae bacterium]